MDPNTHIIKTTQELIFRHGTRSITMDDIAKELGMSKKTIYQYFEDKNEIIHSIMQIKLKEDAHNIGEIAKKSDNVVEEFFAIMKYVGKVIGQVNPNLFYDLQKYHPHTWQLFQEFKETCIMKMVEDTLLRGIKQGLIRPEINISILTRMRMEQVNMGFNPSVFPPDKFNILEAQLSMIEHFLYGVCTLKGYKLIDKYKQ